MANLNHQIITNDIISHDVSLFPSNFIIEMDDIIQRELYNFICTINNDDNIIINDTHNITFGIISIRDIVYIVFYDIIQFREYIMFTKQQILNKIIDSILNQRNVFPHQQLIIQNHNNRWINNIKTFMLTHNVNITEFVINSFVIVNNNVAYLLSIQHNYKPSLIVL